MKNIFVILSVLLFSTMQSQAVDVAQPNNQVIAMNKNINEVTTVCTALLTVTMKEEVNNVKSITFIQYRKWSNIGVFNAIVYGEKIEKSEYQVLSEISKVIEYFDSKISNNYQIIKYIYTEQKCIYVLNDFDAYLQKQYKIYSIRNN